MRKFKLKTAFIKLWVSFIVCGLQADLQLLCGRLCNNADTYFFMYGLKVMSSQTLLYRHLIIIDSFFVPRERMPLHFL